MRLRQNLALPLAVLALGAFSNLSQAQTAATVVNQTYSGSFPTTVAGTLPSQSTVLEESFTLGVTSDVTATTTSYATGGFEPSLILYWPDGTSAPGGSSIQGGTGTPALDAILSATGLSAGTYTLALMDYNVGQSLTATNLSDGFIDPTAGAGFVDVDGNTRTGDYSIDLSVVPSATTGTPGTPGTATPEPATAWLVLLPALAVAGVYGRKRFATAQKF